MHRPYLALVALVALAASPCAQELAHEAATHLQSAAATAVHGTVGSEFASAYFFRGIQQENQGAIAEPHLELGMPLYAGAGTLRALELRFGQWNSLHDGPTGTAGPQSMWYENDLDLGFAARLGERLRAGLTYTAYYSPNGRFASVQELALSLAYDGLARDSIGTAGLQPHVLVAFETQGHADGMASSGTYAEFGIEPTFALGSFRGFDLTLALPARIGLSLGDYYQDGAGRDSTFGYADLGAVLKAPLPFLPRRLGGWEGTLGCHVLVLGDGTREHNQDERVAVLVTCGLITKF